MLSAFAFNWLLSMAAMALLSLPVIHSPAALNTSSFQGSSTQYTFVDGNRKFKIGEKFQQQSIHVVRIQEHGRLNKSSLWTMMTEDSLH